MAYSNATPKRLATGSTTSASIFTIYTVPASHGHVIKTIHVQDITTSDTVTLLVNDGSGDWEIWYGKPAAQASIDGGQTVLHAENLNLPINAGDILKIITSGGGKDFYIGGVDYSV